MPSPTTRRHPARHDLRDGGSRQRAHHDHRGGPVPERGCDLGLAGRQDRGPVREHDAAGCRLSQQAQVYIGAAPADQSVTSAALANVVITGGTFTYATRRAPRPAGTTTGFHFVWDADFDGKVDSPAEVADGTLSWSSAGAAAHVNITTPADAARSTGPAGRLQHADRRWYGHRRNGDGRLQHGSAVQVGDAHRRRRCVLQQQRTRRAPLTRWSRR